jgi:hypothetical protein
VKQLKKESTQDKDETTPAVKFDVSYDSLPAKVG